MTEPRPYKITSPSFTRMETSPQAALRKSGVSSVRLTEALQRLRTKKGDKP